MGSISQQTPVNRSRVRANHISDLHMLLPNSTLLTPASGAAYANSIARWSSAASKPAGVCLLPKKADEVSVAVKYANKHNLDLAVRGGGHSTAGTSSTDGGMLIDLGAMRKVTVNSANLTIIAQGGCTWADVDTASTAVGLCTVGGTVADTGVGGLTLGGGYGFLTGQHGLVIDNLLDCTMVLADGAIITTSSAENPDLFWAIRGAGQNFGVAVSFTFRAFPVSDEGWWAGMLMFQPTRDSVQKVVELLNEYFILGNPTFTKGKLAGGLAIGQVPSLENGGSSQTMLIVPLVYRGSESSGRAALSSLLELQPVIDTMAPMKNYAAVNNLMAVPAGMRVSMKGAAYRLPMRPEFVMNVLGSFEHFVTETPDAAAASQVLWELMDPTVLMKASTIPGGGGAFANRGWHFNALVAPYWTQEAKDDKCRAWARKVAEMFKKEMVRSQVEHEGENEKSQRVGNNDNHGGVMIYGNYDHYEERSRDVFGANYERLRVLKARYDPNNVFNKLFAITPHFG